MITCVGGLAHQGYVDRIYREAALSDTNPYARLTLLLVLLVILLGGLFWAVFELRKLEPYPHTFVRVVTLLAEIMVTITVLIIIGRVSILEATSEITASFTQRLTVLAPSVTDAEYKTLKPQSASMQRKAEYDALVTARDI